MKNFRFVDNQFVIEETKTITPQQILDHKGFLVLQKARFEKELQSIEQELTEIAQIETQHKDLFTPPAAPEIIPLKKEANDAI